MSSRRRDMDLDDVAFSDDAFYVRRRKHKSKTKVKIPVQDIGKQCVIECERGLEAVPQLIDIVNATAMGNGYLPLHASACIYNGRGVLATGWTKGGKTETGSPAEVPRQRARGEITWGVFILENIG